METTPEKAREIIELGKQLRLKFSLEQRFEKLKWVKKEYAAEGKEFLRVMEAIIIGDDAPLSFELTAMSTYSAAN